CFCFSSRRRHTSSTRDWSSDVCSSDLERVSIMTLSFSAACCLAVLESTAAGLDHVEAWPEPQWKEWMAQLIYLGWIGALPLAARSEERRVGKECRSERMRGSYRRDSVT